MGLVACFVGFLQTWPKKKLQKLIVGNDSGMCKASFAGHVPRMFSLIKNSFCV